VSKSKALSKIVRLLPKGQITLPIEFRRQLKLGEDALLRLTLTDAGLQVSPVREAPRDIGGREYSAEQIARFLREDRIDRATAAKVRRLLGRRDAA